MMCPRCEGAGRFCGSLNTGEDYLAHHARSMECPLCGGSGAISEELSNKVRTGEEHRRKRLDRGETVRQAAARLGVSVAEIIRQEIPNS